MVGGQGIAAVSLIDRHFAIVTRTKESLLRMDIALRSNPAGGVYACRRFFRERIVPIDGERNDIFGGDAEFLRDTG